MAKAAQKSASTPASSSASKPATKAKPASLKVPAKKQPPVKAPPAEAVVVKKAAPGKAPPAKAPVTKAVDVKVAPARAVPVKAEVAKKETLKKTAAKPVIAVKSPAAKPVPASKSAVPKPRPVTPAQAVAQPALKKAVQAKAPAQSAATPRPAAVTPPKNPMKTTETQTPAAAKSAKPVKKTGGSSITDVSILGMSDKDYMNEAQLAFFKAKLEGMRDEILENARETGEHLKENEVFADPNDRATVEEENLLEQRVRDRERKLLKKITASLARIEDGSYGYCLETGDPIGIPRLLARPTAELSIEAQEKHERLEKLYAD